MSQEKFNQFGESPPFIETEVHKKIIAAYSKACQENQLPEEIIFSLSEEFPFYDVLKIIGPLADQH